MNTEYCVVLITAPDAQLAERLTAALLEARLAACVQTGAITSAYRWAGAVQRDAEVALVVKTRTALLVELIERVRGLHSYEVPEIIALPIVGGSADYLDWIGAETGGPG